MRIILALITVLVFAVPSFGEELSRNKFNLIREKPVIKTEVKKEVKPEIQEIKPVIQENKYIPKVGEIIHSSDGYKWVWNGTQWLRIMQFQNQNCPNGNCPLR